MDLTVSNGQPEFSAIDQPSYDDVVHLDGFGKAHGLARYTLQARAHRQMLPFDWLRVAFARVVDCRPQMARVRTPIIRVNSPDPQRLPQRFPRQKDFVLAPATDIRQHRAGPVIDGLPEPPRLRLLPHQAPHGIDFGGVDPTDDDVHAARMYRVEAWLLDGSSRRPFFSNS
jgi:hypothetical protein